MSAAIVLILTSLVVIGLWLRTQFDRENKIQFARAVLVSLLWLGFLFEVALRGTLAQFDQSPPPVMIFLSGLILFSVYLTFSKFGTRLIERVSLSSLVLFQSFRLFAELTLFLALREGIAPVQMTFEGYNYDIVTGLIAIPLGLILRSHPAAIAFVQFFNGLGLAFLAVIAFIAMTSMPTPMRLFMNEPSNVWVTGWPYILLPGVLVLAALTAHLLTYRKIRLIEAELNSR